MSFNEYVKSARKPKLGSSCFIDYEEFSLESTRNKLENLKISQTGPSNNDFTQSPIPKAKSLGWKTRTNIHSGFICISLKTPYYDGFKRTKNAEIEDELTSLYLRKTERKPVPKKRTIEQVLLIRPKDKMVVNGRISVHDLLSLQGSSWLNDSIINYYLEMQSQPQHTDIYCFNTFFIPKLASSGYMGVKRWVRNVDLYSRKLIIWPVHVGTSHWCLAVAEMTSKTLWFFDSLYSTGERFLKLLNGFLMQSKMEKHPQAETPLFKLRCHPNVPKQANGYDCGVFTISFARDIINQKKFPVENVKFSFSQADMSNIRRRITQEIIDSHVPPDPDEEDGKGSASSGSASSDLEIL